MGGGAPGVAGGVHASPDCEYTDRLQSDRVRCSARIITGEVPEETLWMIGRQLL